MFEIFFSLKCGLFSQVDEFAIQYEIVSQNILHYLHWIWISRWMRIKSVHNIEMESIWNCASQPALQADPNLCMACCFFHWMRVDVVVFLRTLAFVQINDDWINERSKRPESKNKNKSIARIHTICALCNASWSWVFYHLLKIIYIFISAIFFTRAFFSFFLLIAHFRLDFDGHIFFFRIFFLSGLNHFFFNMWLWILFFKEKSKKKKEYRYSKIRRSNKQQVCKSIIMGAIETARQRYMLVLNSQYIRWRRKI